MVFCSKLVKFRGLAITFLVKKLLQNYAGNSWACCFLSFFLRPLARAICGFLYGVADPGGIAGAVQLHSPSLQPQFPAALAEPGVGVDVVVVNASGWALSITRNYVHLATNRGCK